MRSVAPHREEAAHDGSAHERRVAVIDLGSSSFRLVVFEALGEACWQLARELHDTVRVGAGLGATGRLSEVGVRRALRVLDVYARFCRVQGVPFERVEPVATSAIREAADGRQLVARLRARTGLPVRVLSSEQEAYYGYLAAVNSTTLRDGTVLDLGGGSLQLVEVRDRLAGAWGSWRLGAVSMTERFLGPEKASATRLRALRAHVSETLGGARWLAGSAALVGIGGTLRNLAAAAQRAAGQPAWGVQGYRLSRDALEELVGELAARPAPERARMPGIKPERADVVLAGAVVIATVLEASGREQIEVTDAGLREGVFFARHLTDGDAPLLADVRATSVANLLARYRTDPDHVEHVAELALALFDGLAAAGLHAADPAERELLAAAARLHDIGITIAHNDHHRHSRYLLLSSGLPGFDPRELALIAQIVRYHRKGIPKLGTVAGPWARPGDDRLLARCAAIVRIAERLDRNGDQSVAALAIARGEASGQIDLRLRGAGDLRPSRWGAQDEAAVFESAFRAALEVHAD